MNLFAPRRGDLRFQRAMAVVVIAGSAFGLATVAPASAVPVCDAGYEGTAGADNYVGTATDDNMCGLGGADTLAGLAGVDALWGGSGPDILKGNAGADTLYGGGGADTLIPGPGADSPTSAGPGNDTIRAADGVADGEINCGTGDDTVTIDAPVSGTPVDTVAANCETVNEV